MDNKYLQGYNDLTEPEISKDKKAIIKELKKIGITGFLTHHFPKELKSVLECFLIEAVYSKYNDFDLDDITEQVINDLEEY